MNYIINPSWFYWISVANAAKFISLLLAVVLGIAFVACAIASIQFFEEYGKDDSDYLFVKKARNALGLALFAFTAIAVFTPSKETLIEMMVAKYATVENAEWTLETAKAAVDYIVKAIQSVK